MNKTSEKQGEQVKFQYQHSELLDLLLKFKNQGLISQEQKVKIKGIIGINLQRAYYWKKQGSRLDYF